MGTGKGQCEAAYANLLAFPQSLPGLAGPSSFRDGAPAPDPESRCMHRPWFWIPGSRAVARTPE